MKKTSKSSQKPKQENLIDSPVVIDFLELLTQSALSENEQGIVKRRLLENRKLFAKVLQLLLQKAEQAKQTIDIDASLKKLEEDEIRDVFNKSTLLKLMKEQFDLRQSDILCGRNESKALMQVAAKQLIQQGKMTPVLLEELVTLMDEIAQTQEKKTYERIT